LDLIYTQELVLSIRTRLSVQAAAAHELTHYYRWRDGTEISDGQLYEIDEALTSLEAILRFPRELNPHDIRQLVADAIQRLQMYAQRGRPEPLLG
jgi:hypothetical protein